MSARNRRFRRSAMAAVAACFVAAGSGACFWEDGGTPATPAPEPTAAATDTPAPSTTPASPTATATPAEPSAALKDARTLYREGRFGEARGAYQVLAGRAQGDERAQALIGAANSAFQLNDASAGFEALKQAVAAAPTGSSSWTSARYVLVKQLNDAGRYEEAATEFEDGRHVQAPAALAPYLQHEGARAFVRSGRGSDGFPLWAELLRERTLTPALREAILREQLALARDGGGDAALAEALTAVVLHTGDPAVRTELAEFARSQGDLRTFTEQLTAVVNDAPGSIFAVRALSELEDADIAVDAGAAGLVYYRRGLYAQAKQVLAPALDGSPTANDYAFRAFYLAAAYEDTGVGTEAVRYYDLAADSGATTSFVHRAMYWAARVTEGMGLTGEASQRYVALVMTGPRGEFTQEAAFRAGFVLYEAGDSAGALAAWEGLSLGASARMEYWRGRALAQGGDAAGARAAYERAVALGPVDLHGIEAARELGSPARFSVEYRQRNLSKPIAWSEIQSWLTSKIGGVPAGSEPTAACELMNAGLRDAAVAEISAAAEDADTWRMFELTREASTCGLTNLAAQFAVGLRVSAGVASHEPPSDLLRVSYPIDFAASLENEARKAGVDPLFFASLIRQESLWDPSALSPADAYGLTQVIPPTGEAIAAELGLAGFEPTDLFRPALSLEFGAHYLGGQLRYYGDPLVALSAYNAGPGNAARWAAEGATSAVELVEVIDFAETKAYVTYIYEAYAHYQLAWGG